MIHDCTPGCHQVSWVWMHASEQCRYLIIAQNNWQSGHNTRPHARFLSSFLIMDACLCTVSVFNSCTKFICSPGIIHDRTLGCHPVSWLWMHAPAQCLYLIRAYLYLIHDRTPDCDQVSWAMNAWMSSQLNVAYYPWVLHNRALSDIRS